MPAVLVMSLISILCSILILQTITYSLSEVCAVMSALLVVNNLGCVLLLVLFLLCYCVTDWLHTMVVSYL